MRHSQLTEEGRPYSNRTNELYNRGVKAFGEQDSVLDTHTCLLEMFEACVKLTTLISHSKQVARELPREPSDSLEDILIGRTKPPTEILDDGFEIILVLFEAAIHQIELHVRNNET